jgi:hypothetical protein
VGNEEELPIVKEESNSVQTINRRKDNLIGQITLRNCIKGHDIA